MQDILQVVVVDNPPGYILSAVMRFSLAALAGLALAGVTAALPLNANVTLSKRTYTNAKMTWFVVGLGSCGWTNKDSDMVRAFHVSQALFSCSRHLDSSHEQRR